MCKGANMRKRLIGLLLAIVLALGTIIFPLSDSNVQAVSKIVKAKAIYKKIMQEGKISYKDSGGEHSVNIQSFYLLDIDKNKIPELVIKSSTAENEFSVRYIYTMKDGKLKYCGNYTQKGQAGLQYSIKYKSIYHWWWTNGIGGWGSILYNIKNLKMKQYKYLYSSQESPDSDKMIFWYGNNIASAKKVSKEKYDLMSNKYLGKNLGKIKTYHFYNNTPANIKKVLD